MSLSTRVPTGTVPTSRPGTRPSSRRVPALSAAAFALSMAYTVVATSRHSAPPDFDATTPTVWVGYLAGLTVTVLALRDRAWARRIVSLALGAFLAAAVLVYPGYFTSPYQDTLGWFENDAYVALLAIALYENLRRTTPHERRAPR